MAKVKVSFKANPAGMRAAGRSNGVYRELERKADRVIDKALALYEPHRKTGDYGRAFRKERIRIRGKAAMQVVNDDPKAKILEFGTPRHIIEPKNKKALSWPGARHPVGRVNHPGTPAYHILRNALRMAGR